MESPFFWGGAAVVLAVLVMLMVKLVQDVWFYVKKWRKPKNRKR